METIRILVTDDEIGMRYGVMRAMRNFTVHVPDVEEEVGFEVDQAETGEEAVEKIRKQPPDILLLDHRMPGMSGMDVLDHLSEMGAETLTIMITAYASIANAVAATKRGAYDFLAKPFTPEELKTTIRKAATRLVLAKRTRKLEEERRQVRFELIRVLGHELKAPLNAIEGYLHLIKEQPDAERLALYVSRSLFRVSGMRKLIEDLLDMTQIESGHKNRHLTSVDVREVTQQAIETWKLDADSREIKIVLHSDDDVLMTADRGEIEMLLNNLLSNAVKYNRAGGEVTIRLAKQDSVVSIAVTDTGIGISDSERSRLFKEFVRIRNGKTRDIPGSGLGLSIVKKLAALYEGEVTIESTPDAGSTFAVSLKDTALSWSEPDEAYLTG